MGQYASEPIVKKDTELLESDKIFVGASSMQGWRINMEDYKTCLMTFPEDPTASFFGVFDGHGGNKTAEFVSRNLLAYITRRPEYKQGKIEQALKDAYIEIDQDMPKKDGMKNDKSGTTALTLLIKDDKIYCSNVGDSRAIICQKGVASPLSHDHKPSDPPELERIEDSGNFVSFDRVNGILAMSRALGDYSFKNTENLSPEKQALSCLPDVKIVDISPDIDFVLLASDGIWDVLSNQQAADFVIAQAKLSKYKPDKICENMMEECLAPDTSSPLSASGLDNMTVILIVFLPPETTSLGNQQSKTASAEKIATKSSRDSSPKGANTSSKSFWASSNSSGPAPATAAYAAWCQRCATYTNSTPSSPSSAITASNTDTTKTPPTQPKSLSLKGGASQGKQDTAAVGLSKALRDNHITSSPVSSNDQSPKTSKKASELAENYENLARRRDTIIDVPPGVTLDVLRKDRSKSREKEGKSDVGKDKDEKLRSKSPTAKEKPRKTEL